MRKLKLFFACLLMAVLSIGQMWAKTYKLTQVTSVSAGNKYVFVQSGHAMNNTCSSSALQTTTSYNTTGLAGTETYVWTLETATGGFYLKNVSLSSNQYLNNSSSTGVSLGSKNSIWSFNFQTGGNVEIQNNSNSNRFLGFTTSTSYAYKAYATSNMSGTTYPHVIYAYVLEEETTASPSVSVSPTSLTFDSKEQGATAPGAKTFTITGSNLTGNLSMSASTSSDYYTWTVTSGSLTKNGSNAVSATVTVTPKSSITDEAGSKAGTITISGGGASNQTVSLSTTVTAPAHGYQFTHDFTAISGFSSWGSGYTEHVVNYDIYNGHTGNDDKVVFASANKQSSTITDRPVTKGEGPVSLVLLDPNKYISAVKFVCKQWNTNNQTLTLKYSTDGGTTYSTLSPSVTSTNFTIESLSLPAKTNAVQITFSSTTKQIGISSVSFDLVDKVTYSIGKDETGCTLSVTDGTSAITTAEAGDEVYVSIATTEEGYENASFVVKDADNNTVAFANGKFTMPTKNVTITATATKKQYIVTLSATNGKIQVGEVDKESITVAHGETADLTAVANTNFAFSSWATSDDEKVVLSSTTNNSTTITVTGAATVTANFISTLKPDPGISWSEDSKTIVKGQTATLPSFNNPNSLAVTYSSTNESVAEIDNDGDVTINGVGSTTIKATYTETSQYAGKEVSYTLTVKGRVTWHVIQGGVDAPVTADYVKDAVPTKPTPSSCDASISLVGWTTSTYAKSDDEPATLYTGNVPAVTDNADYYAVWANSTEDAWTETALSNISSTDIVVPVGYDNDKYYGIKANGNSSPAAIEVTVEDGKITSAFDDENNNIKWNITGNATAGYSFYVNGGTANDRLYCATDAGSSNNTSWKVGNPASGVNRYTLEWSEAKNTMVTKDESAARYLSLYTSTSKDWRSYLVGSVTTTNLKFYKFVAGTTTGYTTNCVGPVTVTAPTFDVEAGTYTEVKTVKISNHANDLHYFYTTDGTDPAADGNLDPMGTSVAYNHSTGIAINESGTLKAIAYDADGNYSDVTTAVYTINLPITTIQKLFEEATAIGSSATQKRTVTFGNWIVSAIGSDNKSVYVTDNTRGFVIYGSSHEFVVGNVLSGTVECDLQLYSEFAEIKGLKASNENLTVTTGGVLVPADAEIKNLGAVNTGAPVILSNVTYDSDGDLVGDESYYVKPDNMLYSGAVSTFEQDKIYNVTGVYVYGTTDKIAPRSAADIVKLSKEQQTITWYVSSAQAEAIGTSYTLDNKDVAFAPVCESNSTGAKTYQSSDPTVATINENTGVIEVLGNGVTTITCNVVGDENYVDGSKAFTLKVGIGKASWVAKDWADENGVGDGQSLAMTENAAGDNVDMTWDKGTNNSAPKYYDNGEATRIYAGNTLTLTSKNGKIMTSITFTFSVGAFGANVQSVGEYNTTNNQWTGFANSVTFTSDGSWRITQIDIEYMNGTTTTLTIADIELSMLAADPQDIAYTSNKLNPTIVYSGYDDTKISIVNGQIAPLTVGSTTVTASIAAEAPYSSVVTTFKVTVKSGVEVEENVVILAQKDGVWYALTNVQGSANNSLAGFEVEYFEPAGKILSELTDAQKTSITWKRITDGNSVTFQDANDKYLTGNSTGTNLSVADDECVWTKSGSDYLQGDRTFLYSTTNGYFRCYTPSTGGVTDMPIFVASNNVFGTVYTRPNVSDSKYGTICLPKAGVLTNGVLYEISYYDADQKKIFFDEVVGGVMVAGAPYIFKPNENVTELKVVYTDVAVVNNAGHKNGLYGHYDLNHPTEKDEDARLFLAIDDYFLLNNEYWKVDQVDRVYVDNYRAYIKLDKIGNDVTPQAYGRRRIEMNVNGEQTATGMDELNASEVPVKMMINGQLFILRGEKLYDATGRLVK